MNNEKQEREVDIQLDLTMVLLRETVEKAMETDGQALVNCVNMIEFTNRVLEPNVSPENQAVMIERLYEFMRVVVAEGAKMRDAQIH